MKTAIIWFRRDLRLDDNPAVAYALEAYDAVIPLYIHDITPRSDPWGEGSATRWWLHHSLDALSERLRQVGGQLLIRQGDPLTVLEELMTVSGAEAIVWNRLYTPHEIQRDTGLKSHFRDQGKSVRTFNSALLKEPWEHKKPNGDPYRVFTPFWKAYLASGMSILPEPAPTSWKVCSIPLAGDSLSSLELLPRIPWDEGFNASWCPGENGAFRQLTHFLDESVLRYDTHRDIPGVSGTSRLSPHLQFGEISPRRILSEVYGRFTAGTPGVDVFLKEVGWREFAYHLLYHFPHTAEAPLDERFKAFPWPSPDPELIRRWQTGKTGFPIVDAGMRELWHTGWMHNRVRMIVASLLTKNLMVHWLKGAEWFWDTLVDADLASNTMGWQWTAGSGADAAPYFRVFNPILQGEKFDPSGDYVRRWVPELARLPARWIHRPFECPSAELSAFGVHLGRDYPAPVVDLKVSREKALEAFSQIKTGT